MHGLIRSLRFARRVKGAIRRALSDAGIEQYLHTEDRRTLQKIILPYFASSQEFQRILFVGCDWYTRGYRRFFSARDYWTLEIDPIKRKYGAQQHVIDSLANIEMHFSADSLDLVVCNGVFGWGLNEKADVEKSFFGVHRCLRFAGVLVLGWNHIPERYPFPLEDLESLRCFRPYNFPPLGTAQFEVPTRNRHTYSFYVKQPNYS